MSECDEQILSAYLDDELDQQSRWRVSQHLQVCRHCAAELELLQAASGSLRQLAAMPLVDITPAELERAHQAIDDVADRSILRLGQVIGVIAASVLIVSATWLATLPERGALATHSTAAADPQTWEQVAVNLQVEPLPDIADDPIKLADARFADWMIDSLETQRP